MDEEDDLLTVISFLFGGLALGVLIVVAVGVYATIYNKPEPPDYSKGPIQIETNELGCKKYNYYNSSYWKCPEDLGINSIEERSGKRTITTPVVKDSYEP